MKCLPQSKLGLAKGNVLHDWHAEILAIRAFNRWLVDECADLAAKGKETEGAWVKWRSANARNAGEADETRQEAGSHDPPFALRDEVDIHMYCSEAPCGDASMELTMAQQEDATPWTTTTALDGGTMPGRGNFDQLGIVRRKPARPDAPLTLSKSCSDKLAMKQCASLLSGMVSLLVHPGNAYLSMLTLPKSQYVEKAVERAFGPEGRMKRCATGGVQEAWQRDGYSFKPFETRVTDQEFEYSRRTTSVGDEVVSSNLSALWTLGREEILINGVLQGRKQFDPKGASCVSRRSMVEAVRVAARSAGQPALLGRLEEQSYAGIKADAPLASREALKKQVRASALVGWQRNTGDEDWSLGIAHM